MKVTQVESENALSTAYTIEGSNTAAHNLCPCPCSDSERLYATKSAMGDYDHIVERIVIIKSHLKIERKATSRYKRMHFSASDDRTSAKSIGVVGVIILCIALGSVLIFDIPIFFKRGR